jgi:hypothetical protein
MTHRPDSTVAKATTGFKDLASFYASLPAVDPRPFDRTTAMRLSAMPLSCVDHPQPRPNAVPYIWEATYTPVADFETTRAFYGCYDWHSAVNSTWTLVRILKGFPDLSSAPAIRQKLNDHLGATNIAGDLEFMRGAGTFELPYGYAWLLRLQYELRSWNDSDAVRWAANLQPLATYMSERLAGYFKNLQQPVRTGVHPNTAYGDGQRPWLRARLRPGARGSHSRCRRATLPARHPVQYGRRARAERLRVTVLDGGVDHGQLMPAEAFVPWLDAFLPPLYAPEFQPLTKGLGPEFVKNPTAIASKSHIVGLAFVRAKSLGELANLLPPSDPRGTGLSPTRRDAGGHGLSADGCSGVRRVALLRELGDNLFDHEHRGTADSVISSHAEQPAHAEQPPPHAEQLHAHAENAENAESAESAEGRIQIGAPRRAAQSGRS